MFLMYILFFNTVISKNIHSLIILGLIFYYVYKLTLLSKHILKIIIDFNNLLLSNLSNIFIQNSTLFFIITSLKTLFALFLLCLINFHCLSC